jgi:hypothetical protein
MLLYFISASEDNVFYTLLIQKNNGKDAIDAFDCDYKELEELNISNNYKLSSDHIY